MQKRWRNRLIKDENENHFKNGNKGPKKDFNKNVERFCWEKMERNQRVSTLLCAKGLRWFGLKNLESYVEMVAGLPKDTKMIKILLE